MQFPKVRTVLIDGLVTPEGNEVNFITLEGQGSGKIRKNHYIYLTMKKTLFFKEYKYVFNDIERSLEILT